MALCQLVVGCLIANAIPFFDSLLGLIGGLLSAPISFGFPVLFYLGALARLDAIGRNQVSGGSEFIFLFNVQCLCNYLFDHLFQLLVSNTCTIACFNAYSMPIQCLFNPCVNTCSTLLAHSNYV